MSASMPTREAAPRAATPPTGQRPAAREAATDQDHRPPALAVMGSEEAPVCSDGMCWL